MSDQLLNVSLTDRHDDECHEVDDSPSSSSPSPSLSSASEILQKFMKKNEQENRGDLLQEKCGVFGCIANGDWPTNLGVASIVGLGLVGLQHR